MTDEEKAAAEAAAATAKKAEDDARAARERGEQDELDKKTKAELVNYVEQLRKDNKRYYDRAKAAESERDTLKSETEAASKAKLESEKQFQKLYEDERKAREAAEKAAAKRAEENARIRVATQLREAARDAGLKNPNILKTYDMSEVEATDDGVVDEKEVKRFIKALKGDYPELFAEKSEDKSQQQQNSSVDEATRTQQAQLDAQRKAAEEAENARNAAEEDRKRRAKPLLNTDGSKMDWGSLTDEQFQAEERKLLAGSGKFSPRF